MKPRHQPNQSFFEMYWKSWFLSLSAAGLAVLVVWILTRMSSDLDTQMRTVWALLAIAVTGVLLFHFTRSRKQRFLAGVGWSPAQFAEVFGGGGGLSLESAVVIHVDNSLSGVGAEYFFIASQCGEQGKDWVPGSQRVHQQNGRLYDVMTVTLRNGEVRTYHFDITSFFGK